MTNAVTLHLLFVCSRNQWRSPTAEKIFARHPQVSTRSRGTSSKAVRTVRAQDLSWADRVFVMENKHRQQLLSRFHGELKYKELHVLDIPDDYSYMDPELIQILQGAVEPFLNHNDD